MANINENSILDDVKELLSIAKENTDFDRQIIIHINSAFAHLRQMGIGPENAFRIEGKANKWSEFLGTDTNSDSIKDYIYIRVRMIFDTPQSSAMKEAMEEELKEIEYRLRIQHTDEKDIAEE